MKTKIPKDLQKEVDKKIASLLGFVDESAIMTYDKNTGVVFIGKEKVEEAKILNLKSECEFILRSEMWKILNETMKFMAQEQMFVKSKDYNDLVSGKMWLYHVDIMKKLMDTFAKYKKSLPITPPSATVSRR